MEMILEQRRNTQQWTPTEYFKMPEKQLPLRCLRGSDGCSLGFAHHTGYNESCGGDTNTKLEPNGDGET